MGYVERRTQGKEACAICGGLGSFPGASELRLVFAAGGGAGVLNVKLDLWPLPNTRSADGGGAGVGRSCFGGSILSRDDEPAESDSSLGFLAGGFSTWSSEVTHSTILSGPVPSLAVSVVDSAYQPYGRN
jgi:hypothetical protein